jgi:5'-deoxynucleotidase YfbR-like HD superfamily hydrolase
MSQIDKVCTLLKKSRGLNFQTRWNMYPKTRRESIGEHTFNVALFALMILYIKANGSLSFQDYETVVGALLHDLEEAVTGDIPTLTKRCIKSEDGMLIEAKKELGIDELGSIDYLFKFFRDNRVVELADKLAAAWWCDEQERCGIKLYKHIKNQILTYVVSEYDEVFPEIKEFISKLGMTYEKEKYTSKFTHVGEPYAYEESKPSCDCAGTVDRQELNK